MADKKIAPTRYIYVKDENQCVHGFGTFEAANEKAEKIRASKEHKADQIRVKVSFRSRTGLFDVVVKVRKEVKHEEPKPGSLKEFMQKEAV